MVAEDNRVGNVVSGGTQHGATFVGGNFAGPVNFDLRSTGNPSSAFPDPLEWPNAASWDVLLSGVHRCRPLQNGESTPTPYITRDFDAALRTQLRRTGEAGGLVLIVGDSTSGKSRAAHEALRVELPDHLVCAPLDEAELSAAVASIVQDRPRCVLWLDDLERFVGGGALTSRVLGELKSLKVPVLATMRQEQYERHTLGAEAHTAVPGSHMGAAHHGLVALNLADPVLVPRLWSNGELDRAKHCSDPRIVEALARRGPYGVAEYLAAGPMLWATWLGGYRVGGHPRGAALVAAAVDLARAGLSGPLREALLVELHEHYLQEAGGALLRPEPLDDALRWAQQVRAGVSSLLVPADGDSYRPFDYLSDMAMREQRFRPVPHATWVAAEENCTSASELSRVAFNAVDTAPDVSERIQRQLASDDAPEQICNLAYVLDLQDKCEEAATLYHRASAAGHTHAAHRLGVLLERTDRHAEAEVVWRQAFADGDKSSAYHLGGLLVAAGRTAEAEDMLRLAAEFDSDGTGAVLSLAELLADAGRLEEAEAAYRTAVTLDLPHAMRGLARVLTRLGRTDEAITTYRTVIDGWQGPESVPGEKSTEWTRFMQREFTSARAASAHDLGELLEEQGNLRKASHAFRIAVDLGNDCALHHLADLLEQLDQPAHTGPLYEQAVAKGVAGSARCQAAFFAKYGRASEAEAVLRRLVADGDTAATRELGGLLLHTARAAEAEEVLRIGLAAGNCCASHTLGHLLEQTGREAEAETVYRIAVAGGHYETAGLLGDLLFRLDRIDEAEPMYRTAHEAGFESAALGRAASLVYLGRLEDAEAVYRQALEAGGLEAAPRLAMVLLSTGRSVEAEQVCRQALEADCAEAMLCLAFILDETGRDNEAEVLYRRAADAGIQGSADALATFLHKTEEVPDAD